MQCIVTTVVPHYLFVTICPLETVTGAANVPHMTVSKLLILLLLLLLSSSLLLIKFNFILVYFSLRRGILASPNLKAIYPSTLPRMCKVLIVLVVVIIVVIVLFLLLLLLLSLIAQHGSSTRSHKQSDALV